MAAALPRTKSYPPVAGPRNLGRGHLHIRIPLLHDDGSAQSGVFTFFRSST